MKLALEKKDQDAEQTDINLEFVYLAQKWDFDKELFKKLEDLAS